MPGKSVYTLSAQCQRARQAIGKELRKPILVENDSPQMRLDRVVALYHLETHLEICAECTEFRDGELRDAEEAKAYHDRKYDPDFINRDPELLQCFETLIERYVNDLAHDVSMTHPDLEALFTLDEVRRAQKEAERLYLLRYTA